MRRVRTEKGQPGGAGAIHHHSRRAGVAPLARWHQSSSRRHVTEVPRCTDHGRRDCNHQTEILITTTNRILSPFLFSSSIPTTPPTLLQPKWHTLVPPSGRSAHEPQRLSAPSSQTSASSPSSSSAASASSPPATSFVPPRPRRRSTKMSSVSTLGEYYQAAEAADSS